jgi:hypothetical protein
MRTGDEVINHIIESVEIRPESSGTGREVFYKIFLRQRAVGGMNAL